MIFEWKYSELGKEAINVSRPFDFKAYRKVVFVNTGDVLEGKFLHSNISDAEGLPGQAKKALKKNDILLTEIRPKNGRFSFVDFDASKYVVSTKFMVIESKGRVLPRFLYHVLTNQHALNEFQRIAESRSGTFPQITFDAIAHFPVPVPPVEAQEQLVEFLDSLDYRIDLLRQTNTTLEAIAQTLFKSWFVDFDPVHANAGSKEATLPPEIQALFPSRFVESEQGLIPEGWQLKPLDESANFLNGLALQKFPPVGDEFLPVIKIAQLKKGDVSGADRASRNLKKEYVIQNGDVLFSWSGSLDVGIWCGGEGALNQHLFKVTSDKFSKWFYYLWTKHHLPNFREIAASKATTMGHIQRKHLTDALVIIPSFSVLDLAERSLTPLIEMIINNSVQAKNLTELRDSLLPRLISGKLRLPEVENELEDVV